MYEGLKNSGWKQSVFQESSTRKHVLGERRFWNHKMFRYSKNGATALVRGQLNQAVAVNAGLINQAITGAIATGTRNLSLTVTAGATIAENDLKGSDFIVNDGTGQGQCIPIEGNAALAATGTTLTLSLGDRIRTALDTTSEFTIQLSRWLSVATAASTALVPAGVPLINVTASYYFWNQTGGMASVLASATVATIGQCVMASDATAGAVEAATAADRQIPEVGISMGTQVATEYNPIFLTIDRV